MASMDDHDDGTTPEHDGGFPAQEPAEAVAPDSDGDAPHGASAEDQSDLTSTPPAPADSPQPSPAAKRAPRKRAAKAPAVAPLGDTAEPAAPTRKRATRKKAAVAAEGEPTQDPAEASTPTTSTAPTVGAPDEGTPGEDPAPDEPVVVQSFGLLFQAPEPIVARTRPTRARPAPEAAVDPDRSPESDDGTGDRLTAPDETPDEALDETLEETLDETLDEPAAGARRRRRRGGKGRRVRATDADGPEDEATSEEDGNVGEDSGESADDTTTGGESTVAEDGTPRRRTRRRRRTGSGADADDAPGVTTRVREPRRDRDEVVGVRGSTRLEAKKQRRREGREAGRRRTVITEAEFLARRESVERVMLVRERDGRTQIGVLEDGVLVEHYVSRETNASMAGNIYLGKVQNVLPSMEAAFVDIGKGRNAVLYAGEVNWDAAGLRSGAPRRIENALESGQSVLVQVTKDPIGHKGARLTSQISLPGRYLVYVPDSSMTGISRKLPDTERTRLKAILREVVPESAGVIVRTAAEGASEDELRADVQRLTQTWEHIAGQAEAAGAGRKTKSGAPQLLHGEPDLTVRVIRDVFNEDFTRLVVAGDGAWEQVSQYVGAVAPDLAARVSKWTGEQDLFAHHRVDEQIAKAMDRKVWLPSGGSLVIDRTEAMTVVDVNTGKFIGSGGNLEETVTRNNIEAAEEIVRQLRLRDIGGIIVIDFIDMVLESNRELVVRRLLECLGRDRTKHQVAEVTSLGLVQMTRKRVGSGLIEVFSETCEHCNGRGYIVHADPVERPAGATSGADSGPSQARGRSRRGRSAGVPPTPPSPGGPTPAQIAAAAHAAAIKGADAAAGPDDDAGMPPASEGADAPAAARDEVAAAEGANEVAADQGTEGDVADQGERTTDEDVDGDRADQGVSEDVAEAEPSAAAVSDPSPPGDGEPAADPTTSSPSGRARRRRGRVVAPAGPPRAAGD